jgi:rRNA maturation endonuclease Nob1
MGVHTFSELLAHAGHDVRVSRYVAFDEYGTEEPVNVAVECETCYTVLMDFDAEPSTPSKVCTSCGSGDVFFDAYVGVNDRNDVRTFDAVFCDACGGETSLKDGGN